MTPLPDDLVPRLKAEARQLGLDRLGIAPAVRPPGFDRYVEWIERGHAAGMTYLADQASAREHPDSILPGVRTVLVASALYGQRSGSPCDDPARGRVARYAQGGDYHEHFWRRLEDLLAWLQAEVPGLTGRAVADSAPLLERDFAQLAGLGWIGKNTLLIDRRLGSYTLLGALLIDRELPPDTPHRTDHCGSCTRCLEACPTDAFAAPYQLDAARCLSYWTIEHRGPIPELWADRLDGWAFGCDICQEVCPWNRKAPAEGGPVFRARPEWVDPDLIAWLDADPAEFTDRIRGTALKRTKAAGLRRNAALILGTRRLVRAVPSLSGRLADPREDPVVRAAAAWALGRIATPEAIEALRLHAGAPEPQLAAAVARALAAADSTTPEPDCAPG